MEIFTYRPVGMSTPTCTNIDCRRLRYHEGGHVREHDVGRRRMPPEVRRAELLDAALEVFTELGYERATLNDVADKVGVTKGALYHYFSSKEQLFVELVRSRLGGLVVASEARIVAADAGRTREELLREVLEEMWVTLQQPHMIELNRLIMMELPKFPEAGHAFFDGVVLPARRAMRRIWERGPIAAGDEARVDALVAAIPAMVVGVAMTQRTFAGVDPARLDLDLLGREVVSTLVDGAFAPRQPADA